MKLKSTWDLLDAHKSLDVPKVEHIGLINCHEIRRSVQEMSIDDRLLVTIEPSDVNVRHERLRSPDVGVDFVSNRYHNGAVE